MKIRILRPINGPDFDFPVVYETKTSIYIQIEYNGQSYTFDLRQEQDALTIRASDPPIAVYPIGSNMVSVKGPKDVPGRFTDKSSPIAAE